MVVDFFCCVNMLVLLFKLTDCWRRVEGDDEEVEEEEEGKESWHSMRCRRKEEV